jgi:hypothetical protein
MHFKWEQHARTRPNAVVALLAQHNQQLTSLRFISYTSLRGAHVAGLPDAAGPDSREWHPDGNLAALPLLEELHADSLCLSGQADWQVLAQMRALTRLEWAHVGCQPPPGVSLALVEMHSMSISCTGHALGVALSACPGLQHAGFTTVADPLPVSEPAACIRLGSHPRLKQFKLDYESSSLPAPHFAEVAPVLGGVSHLDLEWEACSSSATGSGLPDLSMCTALTGLEFTVYEVGPHQLLAQPQMEDHLLMLAPLLQLQRLVMWFVKGWTPRDVLVLQHMLPQLQHVELSSCGKLVPVADGDPEAQQQMQGEEQVLAKVQRLLRPGLHLEVVDE